MKRNSVPGQKSVSGDELMVRSSHNTKMCDPKSKLISNMYVSSRGCRATHINFLKAIVIKKPKAYE